MLAEAPRTRDSGARWLQSSADPIARAAVTTLAYFDIFACAATTREVTRFLVSVRADQSAVAEALELARAEGVVDSAEGFWFLGRKAHLVPRRIRFLEHSRRLWPEARAIARLIDRTGLATCGMVTGSLAADNADEHADIDFLFTYPAERAWTSYALIRIGQKIPGLPLSRCCANYAMPDSHLEIRPHNLFTAWELAKAVPLFGLDVYDRLIHANGWARSYLPNAFGGASEVPSGDGRKDPDWVHRLTGSSVFQRIELTEKKRKFRKEGRDVGVDMARREREGRSDRHSPVRSSYVLAELCYRMELLGLTTHPVFEEVFRASVALSRELKDWAGHTLAK